MSPKNKRKQFLMGIILVLLVGGIGLFSWWSWATEPYSATGNSVTINIKPGTTVTQLAEQFYGRLDY
jgi:UPF0755 protein